MHKTVEAIIDENGQIRLLEPLNLNHATRVLVTVLEDESGTNDTALLSEAGLDEDWERDEEDKAWRHLQP